MHSSYSLFPPAPVLTGAKSQAVRHTRFLTRLSGTQGPVTKRLSQEYSGKLFEKFKTKQDFVNYLHDQMAR